VGGCCKNYFLGKLHVLSVNLLLIAEHLQPTSMYEGYCFSDVTSRSLLRCYERFGGIASLCLQGNEGSQKRFCVEHGKYPGSQHITTSLPLFFSVFCAAY
jgi:hypothetical protein